MGSAMAMLPALFSAFDRGEGDQAGSDPFGLGSSGALRAVAEGVLDIAVSGRMLTARRGCAGTLSARRDPHPFVLVTSQPRPNGFKSSDVAEIFKSPKGVVGRRIADTDYLAPEK